MRKMRKKPEGTKNITVTNPEIINMLSDYCDELHRELGFRPNNTQALTRLLTNRKKMP